MNSSKTNIDSKFFLGDIPGANIPASRLSRILKSIGARQSLTNLQQEFLRRNGYEALLQFARGEIDKAMFCAQALEEKKNRLIVAAKIKKADLEKKAVQTEATNRKNAAIFEGQARAQERRRNLRELPDRFGMPFIESDDMNRVKQMLRVVANGQPVGKDDLVWMWAERKDYWTNDLRLAHHKNMARNFSEEWDKTRDAWNAVNACGHWRKAELSEKGLVIAEAALDQASKTTKIRSALLTTGGGALRDLSRPERAARFGKEAHALSPRDFRPCTLLGAVHMEMGAHSEGAEWYEKAEARGASKNLIDRELQSILNAAPQGERNLIKKALMARDPSRYGRL